MSLQFTPPPRINNEETFIGYYVHPKDQKEYKVYKRTLRLMANQLNLPSGSVKYANTTIYISDWNADIVLNIEGVAYLSRGDYWHIPCNLRLSDEDPNKILAIQYTTFDYADKGTFIFTVIGFGSGLATNTDITEVDLIITYAKSE